eukprot:maker-scaffold_14-snap-gene-5.61-mRNA-1 protein AED:0.00 eAED:0.00 QI:41/1/1/1/1/1/2/71/247
MNKKIISIYINGILSPKEEIEWKTMKSILEDSFGGEAFHFHNPFLAIDDPVAYIKESFVSNPFSAFGYGLGAAAVGLGTFLYSYSQEKTAQENMLETEKNLAIVLETVLRTKAIETADNLKVELREILSQNEGESTELNFVAHSHGGMVLDSFLDFTDLEDIIKEFNLNKVNLIAAGVPILVRLKKYESQEKVQLCQIHNTKDPISLLFDSAVKNLPSFVVSSELPGFHSSKMYAEQLMNILPLKFL